MMGSEKDQEKIDEEADKSEKRLKYGAIAAVNAVNSTKQERLIVGENEEAVSNHVLGANDFLQQTLDFVINNDSSYFHSGDDRLVTSTAVVLTMKEYNGYITENIASKRVRIYTTWDDDTTAATTLVPFETAQ